jgi:hypothetical protein
MEKYLSASQWKTLVDNILEAERQFEGAWKDPTYKQAKDDLDVARAMLRVKMRNAEWGPSGCAFVTRRATYGGSQDYTTCLWINRRLRATMNDDGYVTVVDAETAEAELEKARAKASAADHRYKTCLKQLAQTFLQRGFGRPRNVRGWQFIEGMNGGFFYREVDGVHDRISAPGVMKLARKLAQEHFEDLEDQLYNAA